MGKKGRQLEKGMINARTDARVFLRGDSVGQEHVHKFGHGRGRSGTPYVPPGRRDHEKAVAQMPTPQQLFVTYSSENGALQLSEDIKQISLQPKGDRERHANGKQGRGHKPKNTEVDNPH